MHKKINITINHRKIIKYLKKHPNSSFKQLSNKFDSKMLETEILILCADNYISSSSGKNIESGIFNVDDLGHAIASEEILMAREVWKERFIGFVFGLISAILVSFTSRLIGILLSR